MIGGLGFGGTRGRGLEVEEELEDLMGHLSKLRNPDFGPVLSHVAEAPGSLLSTFLPRAQPFCRH